MKRITLTCADADTPEQTWVETYTEGAAQFGFPNGHADPEGWARALVERFNNTLRSHERPRIIVSVELTEVPETEQVALAHAWEKTNAVTIMKAGRVYDTARCTICGATSKRFGVGGYTLDPKYKKLVDCPGVLLPVGRLYRDRGSEVGR